MAIPASERTGVNAANLHNGWSSGRARLAAFAICAGTALLVFVLPLYVPMRPIQTASASYLAGFNNGVALFCAVGTSVAVLLGTLWAQRHNIHHVPVLAEQAKLTAGFVAGVTLASALVLGVCGWLVAASHMRYLGDAGYIIEQATVRRDTGRALYTQIEFAYGPLLLFPEIWLSQLLHCGITAAYYVTLVVESSLGLVLLAFVLNELPMRGSLRRAALVLLAIGAVTPHLGLNYTFLRFVSPFAVLLLATRDRSPWRCALWLSFGEAVELLISPELGLALAAGVLLFGLLRAWQQGWGWLVSAALPLGLLGVLLATLGRPYLAMTASFSRGALNLPVGPYPHLLVLLFALVWLVPFGLGRLVRWSDPAAPRWLALYGLSLAFMPPALGRCDPLHVLFNGVGILTLSLFVISDSSRRARLEWVACIAVLVLWNQFVNERPFELRTAEVLRQSLMPHLTPSVRDAIARVVERKRPDLANVLEQSPQPDFHLDTAELDRIAGSYACVATPKEVSPAIEDELRRSHDFAPGYYAFGVDVMNPAGEQRQIREANACPSMLLPADWQGDNPHTLAYLPIFQGFRLPYRARNPMQYVPNTTFAENLQQNWDLTQRFGPYLLYQRKGAR